MDTQIKATPEASEFIRSHGGRIYVWVDSSGLEHTGLTAPDDMRFTCFPADGFELFQHDEITTPGLWTLGLHHLPQHVAANWGGWTPTIPLMP